MLPFARVALAAYSNVKDAALVVLEEKGFRIWVDHQSEPNERWFAEKNGWDFMAHDPIELLGLVAIYELYSPAEYSEYWWSHARPSLLPEEESTPYSKALSQVKPE